MLLLFMLNWHAHHVKGTGSCFWGWALFVSVDHTRGHYQRLGF